MLTRKKLLLLSLLVGIAALTVHPRAQDPPAVAVAVIQGIGDLTGGAVSSAVRDATRVDGVIYAVGASSANTVGSTPQLDTPVLWSSTGGLQALPNLADFVSTQTGALSAYAINPSGEYIASQALTSNNPGTPWVRVTRSAVPSTTANLNLNTGTGAHAFAALAISDSGSTVYGQESQADGTRRVVRYELGVGVSHPDLPGDTTWSVPVPRGTSSDGLVMIGAASVGSITTSTPFAIPPFGYSVLTYNTTAFRYVHNAGMLTGTTTALPKLTGGAWNFPIAMSSDGAVTVVAGNSDDYPGGEIYLTDAANNVTATLASPNTGLVPRPVGGRADDGAIVVTFSDQNSFQPGPIGGLGLPFFNRIPYVHNNQGWFLLGNILRAQGLDLENLGWSPTDMTVTGVRTVDGVDLVFGQGRRRTFDAATGGFTNGAMEGFVIVLTQGLLASHAPLVNPPADDSLVGAWTLPVANPAAATVYLSDGRYVQFTQGTGVYQKGFERGGYTWAVNGGDWYLNTRGDSNALFGLQSFSATLGRTLTVTGDLSRIANTHCTPGSTSPGCVGVDSLRVPVSSGSIVGAWTGTIAGSVNGEFDGTIVTGVFLGPEQGSRYFVSYEVKRFGVVAPDEVEFGTYTYDPVTGAMISNTEGSPESDPDTVTISPDGLGLRIEDHDPEGTVPVFNLTRIIPPSTIPVIANTPLSASGVVGQAFSYDIDATNTGTFGATGLPGGLFIDSNTGAISGTPGVGGQFDVTITATSAIGVSDIETLTLTIATAATSAELASSLNPATYGQALTLTATVTSTAGVPTGSVTFADGGATLGVVAVDGSGQAALVVNLSAGEHGLTATYDGDSNFSGSAGNLSESVATATTSSTLASSPNPSSPGQAVNFVATVTGQYGGAVSGFVTFKKGPNTIGTAAVAANGTATLTLTNLGTGPHAVTATYSGDSNALASTSSSVTQNVVAPAASTTTNVSSSLNPSVAGQLVTFTAVVASGSPGTPTGTITFRRGQTPLATVPLSGATATYGTSTLPAGSLGITAVYSGNAQFITSTSASFTQVVSKASTTTTLGSTPNPSNLNQAVTFTATVVTSTGATATGSVALKEGSTTIATTTLNASGVATFNISTLSLGKRNLKAVYAGDASNTNSTSNTYQQTVK